MISLPSYLKHYDEKVKLERGCKGFIFLILIWIAFILPRPYWSTIPFFIGHTNLSELAIILLPFVYALYPINKEIVTSKEYILLKKTILVFITLFICVNVIQYLAYGGSILDYIRVNHFFIPLYVSMMLIYMGPRIDSKLLLMNLLLCLSFSYFLSLLWFFFDIEITPFFAGSRVKEDFEILREGRIANVNSGFAYIALVILFLISSYRKHLQIKPLLFNALLGCCMLSLILQFLSFNRTFLLISIFFLFFINLKYFKFRTIVITLCLVSSIGASLYFVYNHSEAVQKQVEQRIFAVMQGQDALLGSVYYNKRDILYQDYLKAGEKYYLLGVPPNVAVTEVFVDGEYRVVNVSDVSLITIFLRVGIIPFFVYIIFGIVFYKYIYFIFI